MTLRRALGLAALWLACAGFAIACPACGSARGMGRDCTESQSRCQDCGGENGVANRPCSDDQSGRGDSGRTVAVGGPRESPGVHAAFDRAAPIASAPPRLYFPLVVSPPTAEPCGLVTLPATCGRSQAWRLTCGGTGAIRDLFALAPEADAPGGPIRVMAVGDGTTELRLAAGGSSPAFQWLPQSDNGLVGLSALYVDPAHDTAVAVGRYDRVARLAGGCWTPADGYADPNVALESIDLEGPEGTAWLVGRSDAHAALRTVRLADPASIPVPLSDQTQSPVPPLTDLNIFEVPGRRPEAWAVGVDPNTGRGAFIHAEPGLATWRQRYDVAGQPRELALLGGGPWTGQRGWAFGRTREAISGELQAGAWRLDLGRGGNPWQAEPLVLADRTPVEVAGRDLVDAYQHQLGDHQEIWLGLSPAPAANAPLLRYDWSSDWDRPIWQPMGGRGGPSPSADAADRQPQSGGGPGHRAIAPLADGRALYAWDDAVWLLDPERAEAANGGWTLIGRRRRLVDVAAWGQGAWLLADTLVPEASEAAGQGAGAAWTSGSALIESLPDGSLRAATGSDGMEATLPRLRALAGDGREVWAVGDDGAALHLVGPMAHWASVAPPQPVGGGSVHFRDAAMTRDGALWTAGFDGDGYGGVWRRDESGWRRLVTAKAPFDVLAALPDGHVWALGRKGMVRLEPGCPPIPAPGCECLDVGRSDQSGDATVVDQAVQGNPASDTPSLLRRCTVNLPDTHGTAAIHAIAARDAAHVFVAGGPYVWSWNGRDWNVERLALLPQGADIQALTATRDGSLRAIARCGESTTGTDCGPNDPYATWLLRFDGRHWLREGLVSVPLSRIRADGRPGHSGLWAVGDWTTVLRLGE